MDLKQHISINEIAEVNGVSLSTVYRVMRGAGKTRNPKHLRVRTMLANAGYLSGNERTYSPWLLVMSTKLTTHSYAMMNRLQEICRHAGIELIFTFPNNLANEIRQRRVTGILNLSEVSVPAEIPCVYLNIRDSELKHSAVYVDHFQNALKIFQLLKKMGYRRIGYVIDNLKLPYFRYLKHGMPFVPYLYEYNSLEYAPELVFAEETTSKSHDAFCQHAAAHFAAMKSRPDAVVLYGDVYARSFIGELKNFGIDKLMIAAVDDSAKWPLPNDVTEDFGLPQPYDDYNDGEELPIICTRLPLQEMVESAVELLKKQIMNPDLPPRQVIIDSPIDIPDSFKHKINS